MNKFAKIGLITSAIILVIGIIICGICYAIGGKEIFSHSAYNIDIPFFSGDDSFSVDFGNNSFNFNPPVQINNGDNFFFEDDYPIYANSYSNDQLCKASDISNINFHIIGGNTQIEASDTDYYQLKYEGTGRIQYYVKDSTLYILGFYERSDKIKSTIKDKLTVYIPEKSKIDSCDFDIDAGRMVISSLAGNDMELELGAGEIIFKNISFSTFDGSVGAGNLEVEKGSVDDFTVNVGMGSISYNGLITGDMDASCGMGSIDFSFDDSKDNHNLDLSCSMGSIDIDGHNYTGSSHIDANASSALSDYNIDCSMGSVSMKFKK